MRFQCQSSCGGKCCSAQWDKKSDFVFLTRKDRTRLSKFLGQTSYQFANVGEFLHTRFSKEVTVQWYLKDSEISCRFLLNGKCSVYEARPTQCRTFPFWPEYMDNPPKEFCPGYDKGDEMSADLLMEQIEADKELCAQIK